MLQKMSRIAGLTRIELVVIIAVVLVIAGIAVPGLMSSQRASNERGAVTLLKTLASAEADFRTNDRDKNGVNDYWTADVKGLFTMTPAAEGERGDLPRHLPLQLISRDLAAADGDETFHPAGGENLPLSQFTPPGTSSGYWFMALVSDRSVADPADRCYQADTGGTPLMGPVHHKTRYGFTAFPFGPGAGDQRFIINEHNTIFPEDLKKDVPRVGSSRPPGLKTIPAWYLDWPNDDELKAWFHSKHCCDRPGRPR